MSVRLIATEVLAGLQMLLGAFAAGFSWALLVVHPPDWEILKPVMGYIIYTHSNVFESWLLYMGLAIIICGFIQGLKGIKSGWLQVVCGLGIITVSIFLSGRQNGAEYLLFPFYNFAFIPLALSIVVFATGLMHLEKRRETSMSGRLMAAKALAVLQTLFGGFAAGFALALIDRQAHPEILFPNPGVHAFASNEFESWLLYLGLAIIICGFIQGLKGIKPGWLQAVCGLGIIIVSAFLAGRQNGDMGLLISPIYNFAFIPLALGIVVITTGLMQLLPVNVAPATK